MENIKALRKEFQEFKIDFGDKILKKMSTKTHNDIVFPPYIPFVGEEYSKFGILIYSTAQNIGFEDDIRKNYEINFSKLVDRLYFFDRFKKKYPIDKISYKDIQINPFKCGILPALVGVFFFAKYNIKITEIEEIVGLVSVSNYYKFSLKTGKRDINPDNSNNAKFYSLINDKEQAKDYWKVNDFLVQKELDCLKPKYIFSFKGRKVVQLKKTKDIDCKIIELNDPSWILNGGSGCLSKNGSWTKKTKSLEGKEIEELVNTYLNCIRGKYEGKKESIKVYLLKYYLDWSNN